MGRELNVLALVKGVERYVYVFDDAGRGRLREALAAHASDPELSLNWADAQTLITRSRRPRPAPEPVQP